MSLAPKAADFHGQLKYHHHHPSTSCTHNSPGTARGMCVHPPIQYTNFPKSPQICQQQLVFRCKCRDKPLSQRRPLSASKFEVRGGMWILQLNTVHQPLCGRLRQKGTGQPPYPSFPICSQHSRVEPMCHDTYNN